MSSADFPDVNYLLSGISIMVTDYSSICIDFSLLGRPVIFYAPDLDAYTATRGLYEPYEVFTGGRWATTWPQLIEDLDECLNGDDARFIASARQLAQRYDEFQDTANRERIFAEVQRRLRTPGEASAKAGSELVESRPAETASTHRTSPNG
jgi:CDP-glycerol glycerophosphotransferase (TagB/SpsB family)